MPTITIRNGNRTLKLTKREFDTMQAAKGICNDIARDFPDMNENAESAFDYLQALLLQFAAANGKPAAKQPE